MTFIIKHAMGELYRSKRPGKRSYTPTLAMAQQYPTEAVARVNIASRGETVEPYPTPTREQAKHMIKKTKHEIKMKFGKGPVSMQVDITIPAGTRVSETGDGQYFVEDISFLDRFSMAWHDANYYGIRLNADQVEVVE